MNARVWIEVHWRDVPDGATIRDRDHAPERVGVWGDWSAVISNGRYRMIDGRMSLVNPDATVMMLLNPDQDQRTEGS